MIKGSIVALITPMNEDFSVDYKGLESLIDYHLANKTDGLLVLGTTGESTTLSLEEQEKIVALTIEKAKGKVHIMVGAGSNDTMKSVALAQKYEKMGADSLLVITPYYNKTNEVGLLRHFETIADSVKTPLVLYNVPARTGMNIPVHIVKKLSKHPNIQGIKEASGDIRYATEIASLLSEDFVMYSGNDDIILPMLSLGSHGVITVWGNLHPRAAHDLVEEFQKGNIQVARKIQLKFLEMINALFIETNPIPLKTVMNYASLPAGRLRLPLAEMTEEGEKYVKNAFENLRGK
ncbi:4-hydroxy-tetrahydrodipicolinate synthase [Pilibacter termitis]|uniref:4-hydroxy-tetrahydrodipicolinate synthase n=1 Tax=Pilibacter termitis TaxID=263852 RepID=A0A1T4MQA6_9ENTE|nr:4-hydroxy-tetrahydrodipicolinate synthase [Pilibacter termitis]SJZ69006.1 4-hydroxy-tetrahydrodipicolinate synthase [Pilibacter termitis]